MSFHICLVTKDLNKDHPTWDWSKMSGDRKISHLLALGCETIQVDDVTCVDRPKDFAQWRAVLKSWPETTENPERFSQMLDILEADPDYWIYLSV